jgi:hypothetical protein
MGTWGPGNFENDRAADIRDEPLNRLKAGIERRLTPGPGVDGVERVMAEVALFTSVLRTCNGLRPAAEVIGRWKAAVLAAFDAEIDALQPKPGLKEARRAVIEQTFAELEQVGWGKR